MGAAEASVLSRDLVFVDLETTGGNAAQHRITEVGIVRVRGGEAVDEWSSLVNPGCRIPAAIEAFTGISNAMVADAPPFGDIADLVLDKLRGATFAAHNARFDYSFLRSEFRRLDRRFSADVLCTVKLSRRLFPDQIRHGLDAVMERHGLFCSARHRALGDARVLRDFWFKLRTEFPAQTLADTVDGLLAAVRLPPQLPPDLCDDLPDGPGIYRFYGEAGTVLYVGKSVSLRSRVLAHFAAHQTDARQRKLCQQVRRVDWQETAGELGALLREAALVKALAPLHNRRLRKSEATYTIRASTRADGAVDLVALGELGEDPELARCFGLFRSRKDARKALEQIARANQLCLKVLLGDTVPGSCFAHQVGRCRGACSGKEPPAVHGVRTQLALSGLKLKTWPFAGCIGLREADPRGGADVHVLDSWAYLGTVRSDAELTHLLENGTRTSFDPDVYRILVRHFAANQRLDWRDLRVPALRP
jgi:DNA polymerase-3 subunit epsilon